MSVVYVCVCMCVGRHGVVAQCYSPHSRCLTKRLSRGLRARKTPQAPTTPGCLPDKNLPDTLRRSELKEAPEVDFVNRSGLTRNKREASV